MKIFIRFLSVLLALQGFAATWLLNPPSAQASEMPDVIINEVMWMGSTVSAFDEWIELRNTTNQPVDVSGWLLTNTNLPVVPASQTIPANGYYLISNYDQSHASSALNVAPDWVENDISIANPPGCLVIELKDSLNALIDSMGCDGGEYFAGQNSASDRRSLERNNVFADGTVADSWHTSVGFVNLDDASPNINLATPKFVNDTTAPDTTTAVVNDGLANDEDWSSDTASASANWLGFADAESGLTGEYQVKLLDSLNTEIASIAVTGQNHTFAGLTLLENEQYHFSVTALNNVGLESLSIESDGFTVNITAPLPVTNLTVEDVAGDNGGSVKVDWDASPSIDQITYRVDYNVDGSSTILSANAGAETEVVVDGLDNYPTVYDFTVVAIDFSLLESTSNPVVNGWALDDLAPTLDSTKVSVDQNRPGSSDLISAGTGAASEMATVTIFDRNPADPFSSVLASVPTNVGLGFEAVSIGNNLHDSVWVQLMDAAGNTSNAQMFTNDIVGPKAAVITKAVASCLSERCNVELNWQGDSNDTDYYQVRYWSGVETKTSLPIEKTSLTLNLAADGNFTKFVVIGFDQYGNPSEQSNVFSASLVPGVITTALLVNGRLLTTTKSVEASREVISQSVPKPQVRLVPSAKAADDGQTDDEVKLSGDQDWLRITIVVILLLIVAGGFYSLSRSIQKSDLDAVAPVKKAPPASPTKKTSKKKTKHKR